MHRNNYENTGWVRNSGITPPTWEPGPAPEPYGLLPEKPEAAQSHRTPNVWKKAECRRRKKPLKGVGIFASFLAALLLLAGTSLFLWPENAGSSLPGIWGAWGSWDDPEESWRRELRETDLEQAPTGDGTVLTLTQPEGERLTAQEIYQQVSPAIVGIRAVLKNGTSWGTGVIMSSDGYIITNAHVIAGSQRVNVVLSDGGEGKALLVGYDGESDLAVLKIDAEGLPVAVFGDSSALQVGETAYAIGNPLGEKLRGTMTEGIISAIDRTMAMDGREMPLVQTTAALNSGNSGGALVNAFGQVVGITNMKMMSDWETIEGLGFAIPTTSAKPVVDQLIAQGYYAGQPMLGITVYAQPATENTPAGLYVTAVERNSDAYWQGIREGDLIVEANGTEVVSIDALNAAKEGLQVGEKVTLKLWTEHGTRTVEVILVESHRFLQ